MKRLTMNQVAKASLRANRKAYRSLIVTVFLAVYLTTVAVLCCYGTWLAKEKKTVDRVGYIDCLMFGTPEVTDEQLRLTGLFSRIGHVYLSAQIGESGFYSGSCDAEGNALLHRWCTLGRLPEKAGEIAVERSMLESMDLELQIGDSVTWEMHPIQGVAEKRTYTLTGILNEQSAYLDVSDNYHSDSSVAAMPAVLLSPEEHGYAVGDIQINRVMTYAPLVTFTQVDRYCMEHDYFFSVFPVSRAEGRAQVWDPVALDISYAVSQMSFWLILGISLLLATGVGISGAVESTLTNKTEEIGMLRAVGATRGQIRRLYGRDTWLIVGLSLPPGIGLGVLTAWLLARSSADEILFGLPLWLILLILLISALSIFLFSRIPLHRASGQPPMGVLRDVGMLRKAWKFRSRKDYYPPSLISKRKTVLHPMRPVGTAAMIVLMLAGAFFSVEMLMQTALNRDEQYDFTMNARSWSFGGALNFSECAEQRRLTEQDILQIESIPGVKQLSLSQTGEVNLLLQETITPYLQDTYLAEEESFYQDDNGITHRWNEVNPFNVSLLPGSLSYLQMESEPEIQEDLYSPYRYFHQMRTVQKVAGTDGKPFPVEVIIIDPNSEKIRNAVSAGAIHSEKLDSGEEILVYAPDQYVGFRRQQREGESRYMSSHRKDFPAGYELVAENHNDYFHPGQRLNILQLIEWNSDNIIYMDEERNDERYARMEQRTASTAVGAVLSGFLLDTMLLDENVALMTTRAGAAALGIYLRNPVRISIELREDADDAAEAAIEERLNQIAIRADMTVFNSRRYHRESSVKIRQFIALFVGIMILFFVVSAAMQIGSIGRQIRADQRMIGTLRAVGADQRALMGCYLRPTAIACGFGLVLGTAVFLLLMHFGNHMFPRFYPEIILPLFLLLCVTCFFCSMAGIRNRLKRVLNNSVVENIREL